jgi:predicted ATPase
MGLHTGEGIPGGDEYVGLDVHRAARIAAAAHGGQVLLSEATRALIEQALPDAVTLRSLGRHRLKDLPHPDELHQLVIDGLPSEFPQPRTLEVPTNLPVPLTSFVGRQRELERVKDLLGHTRLLTLTGAGGSGKTRLAVEAAGTLLGSYPDGVFFVDLAPISDPALVPSTLAAALGVREAATRRILQSLKDALRNRTTLLVMDNFEQVLGAGSLVSELLKESQGLKVIVTSRAALHLSGEQELPVPPLKIPDPREPRPPDGLSEYEAVVLFAQRAVAVDPDFAITGENAVAIAEICARLDGLPLAIELAASRIKLLSPSAMLERFQRRLALLTGGPQDLPARQRTLRETIKWSYDLLGPDQQTLFARLATFVGGWTIEAANAVANPRADLDVEMLDALGSLVDMSLVRKEADAGDLRFGMLETIREFGMEKLEEAGEGDRARRRHASYLLAMAETAETQLTRRGLGWPDRLEREHDNLRTALRWTIDTAEVDTGLRLAGALWRFWQVRNHLAEGRRWTDELLALPGAAVRTAVRAKALLAAGSLAYWLRDLDAVRPLYQEALAIYQELGDQRGEAEGAFNLGYAHLLAGDLGGARGLHQRAATIYRGLGDSSRLAHATTALAIVAYAAGDFEAADALIEEAHDIFLELGDLWGIGVTAGQRGALALKQGYYERCRTSCLESIDANEALGQTTGLAVAMQALALLAIHTGRPEAGVRLAGAVDHLKEVTGGEAPQAAVGLDDPRDVARAHLSQARISELWDEGRAMGHQEAVAFARQEARPADARDATPVPEPPP